MPATTKRTPTEPSPGAPAPHATRAPYAPDERADLRTEDPPRPDAPPGPEVLRELFGAAGPNRRTAGAVPAPDPSPASGPAHGARRTAAHDPPRNTRKDSGWPDHNYGPAYWGVHARSRRNRPAALDGPRRLWEVDDLLTQHEAPADAAAHAPPHPARPVPGRPRGQSTPHLHVSSMGPRALDDAALPRPASAHASAVPERPTADDDPVDWLSTLDRSLPAAMTPARLVGVAAGDPVERWVVVLEAEEVVQSARARTDAQVRRSLRQRFLGWCTGHRSRAAPDRAEGSPFNL